MSVLDRIRQVVLDLPAPDKGASGGEKKNYTEAVSHRISEVVAQELKRLGLSGVRAPGKGKDKQFMGGYGSKGVDVFLSDEKHGLILTSGVKGLVYDARKNLKNRYRGMAIEALELHKRFPYAVCGHLFSLGKSEAYHSSKKFGTVLGEAVALLSLISGRERPEDPSEVYETIGILLIEPGDAGAVELDPKEVPERLQAAGYCQRLIEHFNKRNPFY